MRRAIIEKEVYNFEELSEEAQNRIIENEREFWQDDFELCVQNFIETNFPNSDLKYQYSLNYCQGDGFNFYGKIDIQDIIKIASLSTPEITILNDIGGYLQFKKLFNTRYCYSMTFFNDSYNIINILPNVELDYNANPNLFRYSFDGYKNILIKVREKLREFFKKEDKNFEKLGYDMIHPSIENCIADGVFDDYEYFENGNIFDERDEYERKV
nr:MAG TPA: hypothetical protein [Caudoviricetes sp.]